MDIYKRGFACDNQFASYMYLNLPQAFLFGSWILDRYNHIVTYIDGILASWATWQLFTWTPQCTFLSVARLVYMVSYNNTNTKIMSCLPPWRCAKTSSSQIYSTTIWQQARYYFIIQICKPVAPDGAVAGDISASLYTVLVLATTALFWFAIALWWLKCTRLDDVYVLYICLCGKLWINSGKVVYIIWGTRATQRNTKTTPAKPIKHANTKNVWCGSIITQIIDSLARASLLVNTKNDKLR